MLKSDEVHLAEVQTIRRCILDMLNTAGTMGANENMIRTFLTSAGFVVLGHEVRRHLEYLDNLKAIEIIDRDRATWAARILPYGVDIVEFAVKAPAGIAKG